MSRYAVMTHKVFPLIPFQSEQNTNLVSSASFLWKEEGILELNYVFRIEGGKDQLDVLIPVSNSSPQRRDELSASTCFEAFISIPKYPSYWELNISPNSDWNLYFFEGYRHGVSAIKDVQNPLINMQVAPRHFQCNVLLNLNPWWPFNQTPELSLAAILEQPNSVFTHWALCHPGVSPDFHDRRSFVAP